MRDKTNAFLDEVCLRIREKSVHKAVRRELESHIEELTAGLAASGLSPDEAEEQALARMGSAEEIGQKLDRQHRPKTEWSCLLLTAVLAALGLFVNRSPAAIADRLSALAIGAAVLTVAMLFDYNKLRRLSLPLFLGLCGLSAGMWLLMPLGYYGGFYLTLTVYLKQLFFPLFAGASLAVRRDGGVRDALLVTALAGAALVCSVMGQASYLFVYLLSFVIIFVAMAARGWFAKKRFALIPLAGLTALSALTAAAVGPRLRETLLVFAGRGSYEPLGAGYLTANLARLLGSAGALNGADPDAVRVIDNFNEYTFASVVGRYGYLAAAAIIVVVATLLIRLLRASGRAKGEYGRSLSLCCCALILSKFVSNILLNFNVIPYMGVTLPLVARGGSDLVMTSLLIGLILSVYRRRELFPEAAAVDA